MSHRGRLLISSVLVGLATLAVLVATEPRLAMVWDEGYTLGREARVRTWFRALRDPGAFAASWRPSVLELVQQVGAPPPRPDQVDSRQELLFDPAVLAYFWPFAREEPHGHPPFYALLGLAGDLIAPAWRDLPRARLGPMLLFALTAAFLWSFMAEQEGYAAAVAAVAAWLFQPRLFGHAHYATYDAVLNSLWVLALIAFLRAVKGSPEGSPDRIGRLAAFGFALAVGAAMATKLTGWFLPLPFLIWTAWTRDRRALRVLAIGLPLAVLFLFMLIPPWWSEPIAGVSRFLRSNLTRGRTIPIPVQFLGTIYQTPNQSLPWYNTLVWTVLVTPAGFLFLAVAGMVRAVRSRRAEPLGLLVLGDWLLLMVLRALPHTPGHDGVRLFLPAFGVLAVLVGMGSRAVLNWWGRWSWVLIAAALAEAVISVWLFMPVPLSYFSPLVGGLPGAARLGMEPTYYWDALDADARDWLKANTDNDHSVQFATFPTSWLYLREMGELPRVHSPLDRASPVWYVLQNRPGAWTQIDRRLVRRSTPAYVVSKLGVPLVWVFPYADLEMRRTAPARD